MRPQGFGQAGGSLEDLGWNDMGFEPPKPTSTARATRAMTPLATISPSIRGVHPHRR